jgi:hypothetical protein
MDFADRVLVRLANPATQAAVFDALSLEQIAAAAYDTTRATIEGPYRAVFDELRLGISVPRSGNAEGHFGPLSGSDRNGANFIISGLGGSAFLINALWKGRIVATATAPTARITGVSARHVDLVAIDAAIAAQPGGTPADPAVLAAQRRAFLEAALEAGVLDDDVVDDALIDRELARAGAADINDYFARHSRTRAFGPVSVQYSEMQAPRASPKSLPIAAALVVRDAATNFTQLLADCRMVRDQLTNAGEGRADDGDIPQRHPLITIWMLPSTVFNDADWPGADAAARRRAAGEWLAREGVGLVVID